MTMSKNKRIQSHESAWPFSPFCSATVLPLRVNVPTRGLHHSFSQVLQTEIGKPMRVSFVASSTKAVSWPLRIALIAVAFVGLWAAVNRMLPHRKAEAAA